MPAPSDLGGGGSRAGRRAARALERLRRRALTERVPAGEREAIRARQIALLDAIDGLPCPEGSGWVALLAEGTPPVIGRWELVQRVLREVLGIELHPDTIGLVEQIDAHGEIPALVHIDGWIDVRGKRRAPLCTGGEA